MLKRSLHYLIPLLLFQSTISASADMKIIAFGDMPYNGVTNAIPKYEALIEEINKQKPDLVFHVGDSIGGDACTDEILLDRLSSMNTIEAPLLYTPGDNEWTDCYKDRGDGGFDPIERLAFIRKNYFSNPTQSFGKKTIQLDHQGDKSYPENSRFFTDDTMFITAHIVGSNNNLEARDVEAFKEFKARSAASTAWLEESFTKAKDAKLIVLAIHADMFEFGFNSYEYENFLRHSGFNEFGQALKHHARVFNKPILLIFGDSHKHRVFQPFPKYTPNITAVEVYGHWDMQAVEILLSPDKYPHFRVKTVWNPKQR